MVHDAQRILEEVAFDDTIAEEQRGHAMFLLIHYAQFQSVEFCCNVIERFLEKYSESEDCQLFTAMKETLQRDGFLGHIGG
jgi:hypothetical protein